MESISKAPEDLSTLLAPGKVFLFSKTYCPYCDEVKDILNSLGVSFTVFEADINALSAKQNEQLYKMSKIKTYPNIFIGTVSIGGCDSLKKAKANKSLFTLFKENGIVSKL